MAPAAAPSSAAAASDPVFVFAPQPPPPPASPTPPPPNGYLNGPCGLALDPGGRFYVSDHYHRAVDVFSSVATYNGQPLAGAGSSGNHQGPLDDPCGLALDSAGTLYVNNYHRDVLRFPAPMALATGTVLDSSHPTGVAVNPATDDVYVDDRTQVSVYDSSGGPSGQIGLGSLGDGYGIAVSGFPGTAGYVYVADAADATVKVYDPATDTVNPVATIDGAATPPGHFVSLRDSAVAVDRVSGDVYVLDDLQPELAESPHAVVYVFDPNGAYLGHLKYEVVSAQPSGLAVDNSGALTQGRVYVTSGNTHHGGVYVYPPGAATQSDPVPPAVPPAPLGGGALFPTVPVGGPATVGSGIACDGDACQTLPSEPVDPTLTTLLQGLGNPKVRYSHARRNCGPLLRAAHRLARLARRSRAGRSGRLQDRADHAERLARRCRRANRGGGQASASALAGRAGAKGATATATAIPLPAGQPAGARGAAAAASVLQPGAAGFEAAAYADGGAAATLAGSHPYEIEFTVGLDQSGGEADLKRLLIELPPGLLVDPANATGSLCTPAAFDSARSSPFEAGVSGESCPDRSQVGTIGVTTAAGGGQTRRFGLFDLDPAPGAAAQFGASPFGVPLVFSASVHADSSGAYGLALQATDVPQSLRLQEMRMTLRGTPWDASHNGERGDCLNEAEPEFAWAKCSVGDPPSSKPLAFLTLPTECGQPLSFAATAGSWQQPGEEAAAATSEPGGVAAAIGGCAGLSFEPHPEALLSVKKASSSSGFVFRLVDDDPGLTDPRARIRSLPRKAVIELPRGVTLNPSLGAGLGACTAAQLAAESASNPPGAGCPNASKIGDFSVRMPFYEGLLKGSIYLARPDDPATPTRGAENPFDSLIAVYLVAKSADRGLLIEVPGKIAPDPGDGTLTATFDDLPQLPYTDLEVNFRSGQRAPLVSPPGCGAATTRITLTPWAVGAVPAGSDISSPIESGIDAGPCPDGSAPPFSPGAVAGGVNSNVGSYTPYYVHLSRRDTEQEITSYSLVLPKGITGKLAGIPFCPDAAIAAARANSGFAETANSSCPAASQVGHTLTGYGVGPALTYAGGRIYLAGPYHGSPLSLVTVNAATVGPFDLGTIVIRSAFDIDPSTAQLRIDSRASDPIPHILDGVVLHLRDIRVYMDRFQFTHNPSSCEPSELISTLTGAGGAFDDPADDPAATVTERFQLLNCLTLGFEPKLGLRLRGGSRRGAFPSLRATFVSRGAKDSNLKRIEVVMPHALFLAQNHIRTVCSREQFAIQRCPAGSVYGRAVAYTPLFDAPLRGNVYLRSSTHTLPDLVADLYSGSVHIVVEGRIGPAKDGIRAFFDNLPDAPIDRFTMTLLGGKRGLLQNSSNICRNPPVASVKALGQNNLGSTFTSQLRGQCKSQEGQHGNDRRTGRRRG